MYRARHQNPQSTPIAVMALTLSLIACGRLSGFLRQSTGWASYPIPTEKGTRGTAANQRAAAKKASKRRERISRKK